jgi:hypothetical protein
MRGQIAAENRKGQPEQGAKIDAAREIALGVHVERHRYQAVVEASVLDAIGVTVTAVRGGIDDVAATSDTIPFGIRKLGPGSSRVDGTPSPASSR